MDNRLQYTLLFRVGTFRKWNFVGVYIWLVFGAPMGECSTNYINTNKTDSDQSIQACYNATKRPGYFQHPDLFLKAPEIIKRNGYPVEVHHVTSEDGYIVELHRVPYSPRSPLGNGPNKRPVLVQHGIMASSVSWILPPVHKALAYRLADLGYDVWLGNMRGTSYSLRHIEYSHKHDLKYWDFSWHEMGYYDTPAMIDYVLETTNHTKLTYIGHSIGCTMFFVCTSLRPEYNEKIEMMFALAPIAYVGNATSFFKPFTPFAYNLNPLYDFIGGGQVIPEPMRTIMDPINGFLCSSSPLINCHICNNIYFLIFTSDGTQMNYTMLPVILEHFPDRVSSRTMTHVGQNILSNRFQHYDHRFALPSWLTHFTGPTGPQPETYDLGKVTAPIVVFYGDRDSLADPKDVARLIPELPNLKAAVRVCYPNFNHNDFLFGINVNELVYDKLLSILGGNWDVDLNCQNRYNLETNQQ